MENRLKAGPIWSNPDDFVFTDEAGGHYAIHTFYKRFKAIAASIGRPDARPHDLRHPYVKHKLKNLSDYWPDRLSAKDKPARPVFLLSFQVLFMLSQSLNP